MPNIANGSKIQTIIKIIAKTHTPAIAPTSPSIVNSLKIPRAAWVRLIGHSRNKLAHTQYAAGLLNHYFMVNCRHLFNKCDALFERWRHIEMTSMAYSVIVTKLNTSTSTKLTLLTTTYTSIILPRGLERGYRFFINKKPN